MFVYQGVRNISFSEKLSYVLNEWLAIEYIKIRYPFKRQPHKMVKH